MKRKHSSEQFLSQYAMKDPLTRIRSPNLKKPKSKSKLEQTLLLGLGKGKVNRSKQETTNKESNNSTTNCTYVRPRNTKMPKRNKQKQEIVPKQCKMKQNEIMNIINNFAIKIQRQWRVHQLRTKFKLLIKQIKDEKKKNIELRQGIQRSSYTSQLKFNEKKEKQQKYLEDSNLEQNGNSYDHQKYEKSSISSPVQAKQANSSISYLSQKNKHNSGQFAFSSIEIKVPPFQKEGAKNMENQNRKSQDRSKKSRNSQQCKNAIKGQVGIQSKSLPKISDSGQILITQLNQKEINDRRASYDNCKAKQFAETRRHSTGQLQALGFKKQLKCLQIDKAFQITIDKNQQDQRIDEKDSKIIFQIKSKGSLSSRQIRRVDNDKNAFNIKFPLDKVLKKYKKQLQITKLKKLLSIQNRYNRNEITERSYSQTIIKINQQHSSKLEYFKERQGLMKSNWIDLLNIHKASNLKLSHKYLEDMQDFQNNSTSNIEVSTSFDKWDFNSSAKKSIDNHLDFTDNAPQSSKILSIESVLKELEEEDNEKEQNDRKFKKNKSLQAIESIAERSKEVSQKDIDSIQQVAELDLQSEKKQTHAIVIQDVSPFQQDAKQAQLELFTPKYQNKDNFIQIQPSAQKEQIKSRSVEEIKAVEPMSEAKSERQSLLISQIQALSPNECINSDPSFSNIEEKNSLKDLICKDFKASYHRQQTQMKQNQIQEFIDRQENQSRDEKSQISLQQKKSIDFGDPLIRQFLEIINQKIILNTIKTINSIKFIFARLSDYIKNQKLKALALASYPPIETDINAINTWLLEISHFILDNYQQVIRDNLITIKQPPHQQLLDLSKKNSLYYKIYETIPQYVFKDFQFYYIKTLSKHTEVPADRYDSFSTLQYTFHRSLVDSLNISLMDELMTGKNWLTLPWKTVFRKKRRILEKDHAKTCLQRSINLVSNWGEYGLGRLQFEDEIAQMQSKQYEQQKINLVSREQTFEIPLSFIFTESNLLLLLSKQIFNDEIALFAQEILNFL